MSEALISVIIPVYNTQEYIVECLESLRKQSYAHFEVIIVNDGSSDHSESVISDYISDNKLENFCLLSKENGGVSSARNLGIEHAKGEWVTFIDSDDWVEPSFLAEMMAADCKYHADFYLSGLRAFETQQQRFDVWTNYPVEFCVMPQDLKFLTFFDSSCGRLYKMSILKEYSILFDERVKYCEDNAFNFDYVSVIQNFVCLNNVGYNYRRGRSDSMSKWAITPHMRRHFAEHMYKFCEKVPEENIVAALKENLSFLRVMWNVFLTDVVVDILEKNLQEAKKKMQSPLALATVDTYQPKGKKDKIQKFLWKRPFCVFKLFVNIFYKHVDQIKKAKRLAHFLTH